MAMAWKLLFSVNVLLLFFIRGNSQSCNSAMITVGVTNLGRTGGLDSLFEVEVKNTCKCDASNVILTSLGFSSAVNVDPKLFRREGDGYVINDKKAIPSMQSVKFRYSWDTPFPMSVKSAQFGSC